MSLRPYVSCLLSLVPGSLRPLSLCPLSLRPYVPILFLLLIAPSARAQQKPLPDLHQLMTEVDEHQKQVDKIQENYTWTSETTTEILDKNNRVKSSQSQQSEVFFVNGVELDRKVKKDGKPLSEHEQQKENERVAKEAEKAARPEEAKKQKEDDLSLSEIFSLVEAQQPHREIFRGRSTIVCSFTGKKDAKSHGKEENIFKKLSGTVWVDEEDRQIVRLEAVFSDSLHIGLGLLGNIEPGSRLSFDQEKINQEIWLPTAMDGDLNVRLLFVHAHIHLINHESGYQRFHVESQQNKDVKVVPEKKH